MSGRIILDLAISLDGFIADLDGGFAWIGGQDDKSLDINEQHGFSDFLNCMDIVVMGKRSFEQGFHTEGGCAEKVIYVITHEKRQNEGRIHFISGDVVGAILKEKEA